MVQIWPFFQHIFSGNRGQKNIFYDILERKIAFRGYKNKTFKKFKKWLFYKGVNPWFWSKMSIFQHFFLANTGKKNVFYDILERKIAFQDYKNKTFKKSKNWHFSEGVNPRFWSKNGHFSNIFVLGNIGQKNVFYDILLWKSAFLGYKNKKFKTWKNWHLSKGVDPWFWSKNGHFSIYFFWHYTQGTCLLRYSRTKKRLSRL